MEVPRKQNARKYALALFSDLDGTLIHYEDQLSDGIRIEPDDGVSGRVNLVYDTLPKTIVPCRVLPTLTKGCGYLSERVVELVDTLRVHGVFVALLTGARSSTLYRRLPLLPVVDAIAWENGGRLMWRADAAYVEDVTWARRLEPWTGPHPWCAADECVVPREQDSPYPSTAVDGSSDEHPDPVAPLWQAASELATAGWMLDTREYYTAFRVDIASSLRSRNVQWERPASSTAATTAVNGVVTEQHMQAAAADIRARVTPLGLQTASNLGKLDVFPGCSGKRNVAEYILARTGCTRDQAVAMIDDDNDIELAEWCGSAYLPNVSHEHVRAVIQEHPEWKLSTFSGPLATEEALTAVLERVKQSDAFGISVVHR